MDLSAWGHDAVGTALDSDSNQTRSLGSLLLGDLHGRRADLRSERVLADKAGVATRPWVPGGRFSGKELGVVEHRVEIWRYIFIGGIAECGHCTPYLSVRYCGSDACRAGILDG